MAKPQAKSKVAPREAVLVLGMYASGASALTRCAEEDPAAFCKIVASLLPKTVDINLEIDASAFAEKFRSAQAMLGNAEPPRLRRPLPGQSIEHNNGRD